MHRPPLFLLVLVAVRTGVKAALIGDNARQLNTSAVTDMRSRSGLYTMRSIELYLLVVARR